MTDWLMNDIWRFYPRIFREEEFHNMNPACPFNHWKTRGRSQPTLYGRYPKLAYVAFYFHFLCDMALKNKQVEKKSLDLNT